ncbi:MAG: hypothetical protein AAGD92_08145 [Pseudomonadota bacterium]
MLSLILTIALFNLIVQQPSAETPWLDADALRKAYSGQTHESFYRYTIEEYGGVYFEETYFPDGSLTYRGGSLEVAGRWAVKGDQICFEYPETQLLPGCFVVAADAGCFYSYEVGRDGSRPAAPHERWWIRATIKGTDPQCATDDLVS